MLAIAIADGSSTRPFLALFGRSARATGMETERNNRPVAAQWLHLLNSSHIQRKLEQGTKLNGLFIPSKATRAIAEDLYLTILSRFPTAEELKVVEAYGASMGKDGKPAPKRREAWTDIAWGL